MRLPGPARAVIAGATLAALSLVPVSPAFAAEFGERTLKEGMQGEDVSALQRKLTRLGFETEVNGYFGVQTKRRLKRYEAHHGREVNGVCTRWDARHIERQLLERRGETDPDGGDGQPDPDPGSTAKHEYASRELGPGDSGSDVAQLQRHLTALGLETAADGEYGTTTRRNVKRWEAWDYRRANGEVTRTEAEEIRSQARSGEEYVDRDHAFPVRGPHDYGGAGSRFGADRGDHRHQGQDIAAAQGTPLVAAHDGQVAFRQYQASGAGHYLVIHGADGTDSVYMHLPRRSKLRPGERVLAGERLGKVGCTGSCTGPHLHFELWTPHWYDGGSAFDPLRRLKRWDERT
jgi:murein DD-endopeptidase MepM/ murein hydrolase activator NlpD